MNNLVQLTTSITIEDFVKIDALAKKSGKTRSSFVAERLHNDAMIAAEPVDQELMSEVMMSHPVRKAKSKPWYKRMFR